MANRGWREPSCTISPLLLLAFASLVWILVTHTVADADLWGHLRFGLDLIDLHRLPDWDTYSFTADRAWVNHEWLAELAMGVAYAGAGSLGLNLLKLGAIAVIVLIMIAAGRAERARPFHYLLLMVLVVLATYTRTQVIRPQLFSVPLFCALLFSLRAAEQERYRALLLVPVYFALWVNLHGAWIVGFGCLSLWIAAMAWEVPARRRLFAAVWFGALAATLLNPYGVGMWRFLFETVRPSRPDITDWKPLLQLPLGIIVLDLVLPLIAACTIVLGRQRVRWSHLAIIAFLAWGTWRVGRVDAFLQSAVGVLLAPQLLRGFAAVSARLSAPVWRIQVPFGAALASVAGIVVFVAGSLQLRTIALEGAWLPDAASIESVRRACPGKKVLTWFDWGEYAIWHLAPSGIRVSMDGRRETVYSDKVLDEHNAFYRRDAPEADYPDRIAADCAWLPSRMSAVSALEARGWTVVTRTGTSAVLTRSTDPVFTAEASAAEEPRLFPGP